MVHSGMQGGTPGTQEEVLLTEMDVLEEVWRTEGGSKRDTSGNSQAFRLHKAAVPALGLQRNGTRIHIKTGIILSSVCRQCPLPKLFSKNPTNPNIIYVPTVLQSLFLSKKQVWRVQRRKSVKLQKHLLPKKLHCIILHKLLRTKIFAFFLFIL